MDLAEKGEGNGMWQVRVAVLLDLAFKLEASAALLIRRRSGLVSEESGSRRGRRLDEVLRMLEGAWQKLL